MTDALIIIQTQVGEDRRITLPKEVPTGPVELVIRPLFAPPAADDTTERIRAQLQAAGVLSNWDDLLPDVVELSAEERERIGRLMATGEKSIDELLDEERAERDL